MRVIVLMTMMALLSSLELPTQVNLDLGEQVVAIRNGSPHTFKLVSVNHSTEPYLRTTASGTIYVGATAIMEVDGSTVSLEARPYQRPQTFGGLRLFLECTKEWANAGIHSLDYTKDIRISFVEVGESWGPTTMRFPIGNCRWRTGATYINTWGSLVPQGNDNIYYHRGEDVGAIPDVLPVMAALTGTFTQVPPLPAGLNSNTTRIEGGGLAFITSHMNPEYITAVLNAPVNAGDVFARTGMFWGGAKSQTQDHHCHLEMESGAAGNIVSTYPFLTEAYLRDYPDTGVAVAGGYRFTLVGTSSLLDGSCSFARAGRTISSMRWILHDGTQVDATSVSLTLSQEGFYAEELRVFFDDGSEARDSVMVRAFTPSLAGQAGFSCFLFHTPVRQIQPGSNVTFELGTFIGLGSMTVDFGDGSPVQTASTGMNHVYSAPGIYTVTVRSTSGTPIVVKGFVHVDPVPLASVSAVHIFYNNSSWDGGDAGPSALDDDAIAVDKAVLSPGSTATFANYTSYNKGINGLMIDIDNLAGTPAVGDFICTMGNNNAVSSWGAAPSPTSVSVRSGAGDGGSARVTLIWNDFAISKTWLRVRVVASAATGLASNYEFYVGNAIGETGNSLSDAVVSGFDQLQCRLHSSAPLAAGVTNVYDFNRDKAVSGFDQLVCRLNSTSPASSLLLITP